MFDIDDPSGLLEAECEIGDTRFMLDKMGAMEAWRVLEVIRKEISTVAGLPVNDLLSQLRDADMDDAIRIGAKVTMAVIGLPVPFVEGLRKTLFKHVGSPATVRRRRRCLRAPRTWRSTGSSQSPSTRCWRGRSR